MTAPESPFLTVDEVAKRLCVSRMSIYRAIHAGELRAYRVRRQFRVPRRAVGDYLRAARTFGGLS